MSEKYRFIFFVLLVLAIMLVTLLIMYSGDLAVLNPKGIIAQKELDIIVISTLLMFIVVIPVFVMTVAFIWKFRATNTEAEYTPDWDSDVLAELIWWGVPFVIIFILAVVTWKSSHELDPLKPLEERAKPMTIQVVALQWKWLFIYPEEKIATINHVQFPEGTPINFEITSDAPMNSFWIPELGGQIYAMPGMKTQLHLMAHEIGEYRGSSANISGEGFSGMWFFAVASSKEDYDKWVQTAKNSSSNLDKDEYKHIAAPSQNNPVAYFSLKDNNIFNQILMKYMMPVPEHGK